MRWGTDYLIKCHPEKNVFYVQVSDKSADETYWGRAEDISYERKSYKIDGVVTKGMCYKSGPFGNFFVQNIMLL